MAQADLTCSWSGGCPPVRVRLSARSAGLDSHGNDAPTGSVALARLHSDDPEAYYDVKDPVCDIVMDAAERWADDVAWSP